MTDAERTGRQERCVVTGREQGLIGTYDVRTCRQAFRERARDVGFRTYE